jgi:hypothetical protein
MFLTFTIALVFLANLNYYAICPVTQFGFQDRNLSIRDHQW